MTQSYTPTFMEKLLGRRYKWWYVIRYEQKLAFISRWNIFLIILRFLIPLIVTFIVIYNVSQDAAPREYLILASLLYQFYALFIGPAFEITNLVINGGIAKHLLRPTSYWSHILCRIIGYNTFPLVIRLVIFSVTIIIFEININLNYNLIIALFLVLFTTIISFSLEKLLASVSFFNLQGNKTFLPFFYDTMPFLSGSLISLEILNSYFSFLKFTPFSYISFHPMQIYLGKYDTNQTILVFLGGIAWCLVLYFLAKLVFKLGLKKNESVGL